MSQEIPPTSRPPGSSELVTTTLFISNLHCPSCVTSIRNALDLLRPKPDLVSHSIVSHSIIIRHDRSLSVEVLSATLAQSGFEIHSVFPDGPLPSAANLSATTHLAHGKHYGSDWEHSLQQAASQWLLPGQPRQGADSKQTRLHIENCSQCQADARGSDLKRIFSSSPPLDTVSSAASENEKDARSGLSSPALPTNQNSSTAVDSFQSPSPLKAILSIEGMTCSACASSISQSVAKLPWVHSIEVSFLTNSASVTFDGKSHTGDIIAAVDGCGFEATLEVVEDVRPSSLQDPHEFYSDEWQATYSVQGMTCSSCVGNLTSTLSSLEFAQRVDVSLLNNSATVIFEGKDHLDMIKEAIDGAGYDASLESVFKCQPLMKESPKRSASIRIDGMYCPHCPSRILDALRSEFGDRIEIQRPLTTSEPIVTISYTPTAPRFTIRSILAALSAVDPGFSVTIFHPPTIEDRARDMRTRERRHTLYRLGLSVAVAIPTFIIGVVLMQLVDSSNPARRFIMQPMWTHVSRAQWILFILATPVYFLAADIFHRRTLKELQAMWRPESKTPIPQRFYRFGSMNMLISLGTTIAYFASIAELGAASTQPVSMGDYYFDSVVFLTMFLLIGRFLEAHSKAKTGDAVTSLGNLRPGSAVLIDSRDQGQESVSIDLLEVGDNVRVAQGSSPPFDGIVVEGETSFDESSLTGESRPVRKSIGDTVYSGTVNQGNPIIIRIANTSGGTLLDQIIKVVREGQTKRAPLERAADVITSHFVPIVVLIAVSTWIIWLALGLGGVLPDDYRDANSGGWPLWSLRFAIAVFVIACPCGIGLAAPTALFVGGGLAARHGILVKGGGEAFQEASALDVVVLDKTGTLTQGGNPAVTSFQDFGTSASIYDLTRSLEESSSHPIAKALVSYCSELAGREYETVSAEEIPGRGMKGRFKGTGKDGQTISVIVGNERLMAEYGVPLTAHPGAEEELQNWKRTGQSVALVAISSPPEPGTPSAETWELVAMFGISDPIRPEAKSTVAALQRRGIDVWMLSGDNATTAQAVGEQVGIPSDQIIAGVLPDQKADKIQYLQKALPKRTGRSIFSGMKKPRRATIAMVGDGINDSPALTMADVGIAIGSGSDVAMSSADFILMSSNLNCVLTLIDLSRLVFRRVWFNFGWALIYNILAMPIAAGVLYPVWSHGSHVRLDPVWASLAMALSSVSVVCSSLLLRTRIPGVGFRAQGSTWS